MHLGGKNMSEHSIMQFLDYKVEKLDYKMDKRFNFDSENKVQMEQNLGLEIQIVSDDEFIVKLEANIHGKDKMVVPFKMVISILGRFHLEKWQETTEKQNMVKYNAPAILFPYLRATITNVTAAANISPYVLPLLNLYEVFNFDSEQSE